jgi:hypothetical protein
MPAVIVRIIRLMAARIQDRRDRVGQLVVRVEQAAQRAELLHRPARVVRLAGERRQVGKHPGEDVVGIRRARRMRRRDGIGRHDIPCGPDFRTRRIRIETSFFMALPLWMDYRRHRPAEAAGRAIQSWDTFSYHVES